jgi:hypothetical protein
LSRPNPTRVVEPIEEEEEEGTVNTIFLFSASMPLQQCFWFGIEIHHE